MGIFSLKKFSQTKTQVEITNINYYDLFYTIIKNRDENMVEDIYDNNSYND